MKEMSLFVFCLLIVGTSFVNITSGENKTFLCQNPSKTESLMVNTDTIQFDGPYVFYGGDKIRAKYIVQSSGNYTVQEDSLLVTNKAQLVLKIGTDQPGIFFNVHLKDKIEIESAVTKNVKKQFALSDIEGNFGAFRKLLQANGVINNELEWTFGDGHLVLIGDFFDRGQQVTELLWFIYALEEKAKAAGGYVHFVLGNHEIMNLSGDLRYLNAKYTTSALLLGEQYESLYTEQTELGRWLRSKNILERVGDVLYIHGGISSEMNTLNISAKEINTLARPYYADTIYNYKDPRSNVIMGDLGPFWYRGYYSGKNKASIDQVDSTLWQFNVKRIATGHSIVADTVSAWFKGRLFNTDTHHAEGKSEALLIEGNKFYRVNATGTKALLR